MRACPSFRPATCRTLDGQLRASGRVTRRSGPEAEQQAQQYAGRSHQSRLFPEYISSGWPTRRGSSPPSELRAADCRAQSGMAVMLFARLSSLSSLADSAATSCTSAARRLSKAIIQLNAHTVGTGSESRNSCPTSAPPAIYSAPFPGFTLRTAIRPSAAPSASSSRFKKTPCAFQSTASTASFPGIRTARAIRPN